MPSSATAYRARDTCVPQIIRRTVVAAARSSAVGFTLQGLAPALRAVLGVVPACTGMVLLIVIASKRC